MRGRLMWWIALMVTLAAATQTIGWGSVVVVAAVFAYVRSEDPMVPLLAALAGAVSWGALLWIHSWYTPIGRVADVVGTAMQVGPGALVALTLAFPALLAASAAGVVRGVVGRRAAS